jgi:L-serine dehydratase
MARPDYDTQPGANVILMATDAQADVILRQVFYSIGGGFVMTEEELAAGKDTDEGAPVPYPFKSAAEMLRWRRTAASPSRR